MTKNGWLIIIEPASFFKEFVIGGHKTIRSTSDVQPAPVPPPPTPDYNVTGDPTPDCRCNYFYCGIRNGKPYYRREDGQYFLWWGFLYFWMWRIAHVLDEEDAYWYQTEDSPVGAYEGMGGFEGTPVVGVGGH